MKTNVAESSIESFDHLKMDGLSRHHQQVVDVLKDYTHPMSCREVTGAVAARNPFDFWENSKTSGAINRLVAAKIVKKHERACKGINGIAVNGYTLAREEASNES